MIIEQETAERLADLLELLIVIGTPTVDDSALQGQARRDAQTLIYERLITRRNILRQAMARAERS